MHYFINISLTTMISWYFYPHLIFNYGNLVEFLCLKNNLIDSFDN